MGFGKAQPGIDTGNVGWITEDDIRDPEPLPQVPGWRILARPVAIRPKTKGGIIIPETAMDDVEYLNTIGRILAMGPACFKHEAFHVDGKPQPWAKVGDFVFYGKNAGRRIMFKGVKMVVLDERDILLVTDNPSHFDPNY